MRAGQTTSCAAARSRLARRTICRRRYGASATIAAIIFGRPTSRCRWRRYAGSVAFDESFSEYGWEDIDVGLRLRFAGVRAVFRPQALRLPRQAAAPRQKASSGCSSKRALRRERRYGSYTCIHTGAPISRRESIRCSAASTPPFGRPARENVCAGVCRHRGSIASCGRTSCAPPERWRTKSISTSWNARCVTTCPRRERFYSRAPTASATSSFPRPRSQRSAGPFPART